MARPQALLALLISLSAQSAPYKCVQPGGDVVYQQHPCPESDRGGEMHIDPRPSGDPGALPKGRDLSVEGQLRALEADRAKGRKEREDSVHGSRKEVPAPTYDRAQCAKHRAQAARWQEAVRGTYRTQDQKTHNRRMLEHHQALVERYCPPE